MTREDYLKSLIKQRGITLKDFAKKIEMPYSTLLSILNTSVGGASVDNVIKICRGLQISIAVLQGFKENEVSDPVLTENEWNLIEAFRRQEDMQKAVRRILQIEDF
ncbi:helix-turn-helix domain-containing protein [Acetivibrio sp. MSJd-27]|uniref:helix-turn-helix domain-containing protein n=1 Tax=Acetivibrio sp. MSJd-27 TaxID=2841523 RepID=UPI001C128FC6|nr:helix-turn-helix transcriptional regulator [Acetivibrio sp. MSJd-27]MBU5450726.1 helix-turn-helix transcriptional regulator [Acetivibrio sp. MSJd-27]